MYRMFRECLMRSSDYDPVNGQLALPVADEGGLDLISAKQLPNKTLEHYCYNLHTLTEPEEILQGQKYAAVVAGQKSDKMKDHILFLI